MSIRANWFVVFFKSSTSLRIFCQVLFIIEIRVLKSSTITVELCISPFSFVKNLSIFV